MPFQSLEQPALFADFADALPARAERRALLGDLWGLGDHRLLVGDATNAGDVAQLLAAAPESPRMLITDPPYGVGYDYALTSMAWFERLGSRPRKRASVIPNDDRADWATALTLSPAPIAYIWHAAKNTPEAYAGAGAAGYNIRQQIIWAKNKQTFGRSAYQWIHECCIYAVRESELGEGGAGWIGGHSQSTVWQVRMTGTGAEPHDRYGSDHPTQKPVELFQRPLRNHIAPVALDLFVGSGTLYIAAERERRVGIGLEINPEYADMALSRWEEYTGGTARLISRR